MKRIILVLSVAALMAAMLVVMAIPAFADPAITPGCFGQAVTTTVDGGARGEFLGKDGFVRNTEAAGFDNFGEVNAAFKENVCGQETRP